MRTLFTPFPGKRKSLPFQTKLHKTIRHLSKANGELGLRNKQLKYAHHYAEAIISTIREPFLVLDKDLRIKDANSSYYKIFRKTKAETEGKLFYELDNHQWDIPELRNLLERTLNETMFYESYELKQQFINGARMLIVNARKIISTETNEQLILLAIEDVTVRRSIEEKLKVNADYLKAILETSPQMVSTASSKGAPTYFNQFFLNYTGLSFQRLLAVGWQDAVPVGMREEVNRIWMHALATGEDFNMEFPFRRGDGIYRWHISRALAIRNEDGLITSWVGITSDNHEQKMLAEELERKVKERTESLRKSNIDLELTKKNLAQFTFIASHDLQEPLRKIQVYSNLMAHLYGDQLPEGGTQFLAKINKSSERMSELINDIRNFSGIDHSENVFIQIEIQGILNEVIHDFKYLLEEKKATIIKEDLPSLPAMPIQIKQLFYNLISNAIKFSHPHRPLIITITSRLLLPEQVVKYTSLNAGDNYYEIIFQDNGIGVEEEYLENIFIIFQRLHARELYPGTGIGLALCKKIVLHHQGAVFATSKPDEGTAVHLILPLFRDISMNNREA